MPQLQREALGTADDAAVVGIGVGEDDPEDLQDRVGEVGVPASGAEPDLAEGLEVLIGETPERGGVGEEAVEGLVVIAGDELVPQLFERRDVPLADGLLNGFELSLLEESLSPGFGDLPVERRQIIRGLRTDGPAVQLDDGGGAAGESGLGNSRVSRPSRST